MENRKNTIVNVVLVVLICAIIGAIAICINSRYIELSEYPELPKEEVAIALDYQTRALKNGEPLGVKYRKGLKVVEITTNQEGFLCEVVDGEDEPLEGYYKIHYPDLKTPEYDEFFNTTTEASYYNYQTEKIEVYSFGKLIRSISLKEGDKFFGFCHTIGGYIIQRGTELWLYPVWSQDEEFILCDDVAEVVAVDEYSASRNAFDLNSMLIRFKDGSLKTVKSSITGKYDKVELVEIPSLFDYHSQKSAEDLIGTEMTD